MEDLWKNRVAADGTNGRNHSLGGIRMGRPTAETGGIAAEATGNAVESRWKTAEPQQTMTSWGRADCEAPQATHLTRVPFRPPPVPPGPRGAAGRPSPMASERRPAAAGNGERNGPPPRRSRDEGDGGGSDDSDEPDEEPDHEDAEDSDGAHADTHSVHGPASSTRLEFVNAVRARLVEPWAA